MKRIFRTMLPIGALLLSVAMAMHPADFVHAARDAVFLCLDVVIPSLFPFFICSRILIRCGAAGWLSRYLSRWMRPLFGVPGSGALAVVLGTISGYPIGASCAAGLYQNGDCSKTEAERMLSFCNNSGPLFILGAVGVGMLQHQGHGMLLYVVHVVSALLTGLLFRRFGGNKEAERRKVLSLPSADAKEDENALTAIGLSVADAIEGIGKVCGFVILFAVMAAALPKGGAAPFLYGLLEITGGIHAILESGTVTGSLLLPMLSFFLALSGVSVLLQTAAIVLPAGLSVRTYLIGKLTQAVLAFLLTALWCYLFPNALPAFSLHIPEAAAAQMPTAWELFLSALCGILFSAAALVLLCLAADKREGKRRQEKKETGLW